MRIFAYIYGGIPARKTGAHRALKHGREQFAKAAASARLRPFGAASSKAPPGSGAWSSPATVKDVDYAEVKTTPDSVSPPQ